MQTTPTPVAEENLLRDLANRFSALQIQFSEDSAEYNKAKSLSIDTENLSKNVSQLLLTDEGRISLRMSTVRLIQSLGQLNKKLQTTSPNPSRSTTSMTARRSKAKNTVAFVSQLENFKIKLMMD